MKEAVIILLSAKALLALLAAGTSMRVYFPTDDIAVACGSSGNYSSLLGDSRNWVGDVGHPKYAPKSADGEDSKIFSAASVQGSREVPNAVPYNYARLSTSPFTHTFVLEPGPKFIRLHFSVADYNSENFTKSNAVFTVKAGEYTLLKDFRPSLAADYLKSTNFYKEFVICVGKNQPLILRFSPSVAEPDSYAFVNGIDIISMPDELYYMKRVSSDGIVLIGQSTNYVIDNYDVLETVKRVNVGGAEICPGEDTGMFRSWEPDERYLVLRNTTPEYNYGVLPVNSTILLTYSSQAPNYTAPDYVYKTARSMGNNAVANLRDNLTWSFMVDSNFYYLVRLHFCEFQSEITRPTDRVFQIFIDSQTAELRADILEWAGKGIPAYRDYVVAMFDAQSKSMNLRIALHPNGYGYTKYSDAILNGIELFKINDTTGSLAKSNPDSGSLGNIPPIPSTKHLSGSAHHQTIVGVISGGISCFAIISLLCLFVYRRTAGKGPGTRDEATSHQRPVPHDSKMKGIANIRGSFLSKNLCRRFLLAEIKAATNNFDENFVVGVGGFGNVYKGYIDGGSMQVAVKRLNHGSQQGEHEFMTEIEMLSQLRHRHLVSLIGYCNESGEMILVYDYMTQGTLREHLYGANNPPLSWQRRLEICIGAARGLQYLHSGAKQVVIHRDIKTTNILLDEKWGANVSDFGLSKFVPREMSTAQVSTVVKGTIGYLDPEYYRRQQLTEKSDVYSFGVVLLEVLCARPPVDRLAEEKQINLAQWAHVCYKSGTIQRIVDPKVKDEIVPECLMKFCEIAISCLNDDGVKRPSMNDIVQSLAFTLKLQESLERERNYHVKPDGSGFDNGEASTHDHRQLYKRSLEMTSSGSAELNSRTKSQDSEIQLHR
ncbi:hypothetical protein MLD38_022556 [Melastoma candidum]|uniref:Uncharacterized protein n=1 Tax=Melastoma candidum TaxID=119954 RepID=A0ACB9QJN1_9MYRT|nr:hypothetical protein MLD38_022556 [Melastoma candidum]